MEPKYEIKKLICKHCGYPVEFTNLSGYCNHVYYPDNCETCKNISENMRTEEKIFHFIVDIDYNGNKIIYKQRHKEYITDKDLEIEI